MDIREKYYLITGDFDGAYGMMENDQEAFKFSENTLQRALDMYQGMDSGNEKMFFREQTDSFGPRAGASLAQMYPISRQAGRDQMDIQLQAATNANNPMDLLQAIAVGASGAFSLPMRRVGAMQGLLNFFMDR